MFSLFKLTFTISLVLGTMITISSNSWLGMWLGLEVNLLSIIPLMTNTNNPRASESALKYFITQALASAMLMTSVMMINSETWMNSNLEIISTPDMLMTSSLLMKTGAAPFHFWFPEVVEGTSWNVAWTLLTWQKIAPMIVITYNGTALTMMIAILMSVLVGSILGLNQTSLRKILSYSSINHMGWMLSVSLFMEKIWALYFTVYAVMNSLLIWMFKTYQTSHINQLTLITKFNPILKAFFMMNLLSLGGTPPFIGFLPKWMVIQYMISNQMFALMTVMILTTLITLYYYLRISLSSLISSAPMNPFMKSPTQFKGKSMMMMNAFIISSLILYLGTFNLA